MYFICSSKQNDFCLHCFFLFLNEIFTWFITLNLADLLLCILIKISSGFQCRFKKAAIFKEAATALVSVSKHQGLKDLRTQHA